MSRQLTREDLANVRIPAELNGDLDLFFSALKARTLEAAVRRAACRSAIGDITTVEKEDILECAREALTESLSNVIGTFRSLESRHVRIAS